MHTKISIIHQIQSPFIQALFKSEIDYKTDNGKRLDVFTFADDVLTMYDQGFTVTEIMTFTKFRHSEVMQMIHHG